MPAPYMLECQPYQNGRLDRVEKEKRRPESDFRATPRLDPRAHPRR
jgi:hypothetical protein